MPAHFDLVFRPYQTTSSPSDASWHDVLATALLIDHRGSVICEWIHYDNIRKPYLCVSIFWMHSWIIPVADQGTVPALVSRFGYMKRSDAVSPAYYPLLGVILIALNRKIQAVATRRATRAYCHRAERAIENRTLN